jgi:3-dehydroquinate synthase
MQEISLTVPGQAHTCRILVGSGLLEQAGKLLKTGGYSNIFILTGQNVERLWLPKLREALPQARHYLALPAGESIKHIESIEQMWRAMRAAGCDRKSLVIIIGGGVIGDMGGFAASTYMRGVTFVQIPTTLLAQVDSSVGDKTGFDFDNIKNLIGTFAQPAAVLIDTDTLATLPERELVAGFAEMLKYGLIRDADFFAKLALKKPGEYSNDEFAGLIAASLRIKIAIIEHDEKESGERKLVNFGHTVGHAVEALSWNSDHPLLHGEAVAIGMAIEAELSRQKGYLSIDDVQTVRRVLTNSGLSTRAPYFPIEKVLEKMRADKKNERGVMLFTLLESIGKGIYNQTIDEHVLKKIIISNMELSHA